MRAMAYLDRFQAPCVCWHHHHHLLSRCKCSLYSRVYI